MIEITITITILITITITITILIVITITIMNVCLGGYQCFLCQQIRWLFYKTGFLKWEFFVFIHLWPHHISPTSDGSAAAVLASAEFVKKHNLQDKAVEILGMEMATDLSSTFNENSCIKLVSGLPVKSREKEPAFSQVSLHRRRSKRGTPSHVLVPKNTFTDVFDNTGDISDFRAHIFCSQTTQELPKKHNEAGPPEQLPTDALSQIYYGHTRHYYPSTAFSPS